MKPPLDSKSSKNIDRKLRKRRHNMTTLNASSSNQATSNTTNENPLDHYLQACYNESSTTKNHYVKQWRYWCIILSCGMANSSDAAEILCLSYILSDDSFQEAFLQESKWKGGLLAAAVFLGMFLGGLFLGTLGDWTGRRPMLLAGLACNSIAGILASVSPNFTILTLLRFIAGIGIGTTVPPLFSLVTELAPPSQRGFCVTIVASFWMVGSIFVAVTAWIMMEHYQTPWRIFAMTCALPSALGWALCQSLVPESPRFLAMQQQHHASFDVARFLGKQLNSANSTLTVQDLERAFSKRPDHCEKVSTLSTNDSSSIQKIRQAWTEFSISCRQLYTSPNLRPVTWPLQIAWFSLSFGSYGLLTWINTIFVEVHLHNVYQNALLFAASNLPGNIITGIWMDRVKRGHMLQASIIASALCLVFFAIFSQTQSQFGIVASACAFQCFTIAAWNTIDCMTSELFPTYVRSSGMAVCAASGRIGAMVAQFVNGYLIQSPVRLLLTSSLTLLLGALTPLLLPSDGDLTGQSVPDFATDPHTTAYRNTEFQQLV